MTDTSTVAIAAASGDASPAFSTFTLDGDITQADGAVMIGKGTEIRVRKPRSGEMRGLTMMALIQLDYAAIETISPRITTPVLSKQHVAGMEPADLMQLGSEIMDFLLPTAAKAASRQA